ncbi:MAG: RNA polymerase sigma factor [Candidatus Firestonebacteria bacterium]
MADLLSKTDEGLMLLAGKGNKKALELLVEKYNKPLINYFYKHLYNVEDAKDFTQQTFLQIHKSAKRYRQLSKFTTWMYTIARNIYINEIARRQKVRFISLEDTGDKGTGKNIVEDAVAKKDTAAIVREVVNKLPAEYKDVLILQVYQELKCCEIAKILKIPEGTVWSRLHYGMKIFKKEYIKRVGKNEM